MNDDLPITAFTCGPSRAPCKCSCPDSCEHKWDGPVVMDETSSTVTCSRCGMSAMEHSLWVVP